MLTLLKQARAFGLGVVLATQNPVDLDYKGLSNAGTWFLGRLQTQRDKDRVLEGLEGASTAAGHAFDRQKMDEILSGLGSRVFVMNNVHDDQPVVFQTRWTLSYLRGPLTREQIQTLMAPRKQAAAALEVPSSVSVSAAGAPTSPASATASAPSASSAVGNPRPVVPPDVPEFFVPRRARSQAGESLLYRPAVLGVARLHYADEKRASTTGRRWPWFSGSMTRCRRSPGMRASRSTTACQSWTRPPRPGPLRPVACRAGPGQELCRVDQGFEELSLPRADAACWNCPELKEWSRPLESEREFRLRLVQASREKRDHGVEALRAKYAPKLEAIQEQIRRAREQLEREQAQRVEPTGTRRLRWAARCWERFWVARRSARPTWAVRPPPPRLPAGPRNSAATSARPQHRSILEAKIRRASGQVPGRDRVDGCRAAPRGIGARAAATSSQEDRHHRREGRPGLDALSGRR